MVSLAKISRFVGDAASWAALGDVFGRLFASISSLPSPDSFGLLGAVAGICAALALSAPLTEHRQESLIDCLRYADFLFVTGQVDEEEHRILRLGCIRKKRR